MRKYINILLGLIVVLPITYIVGSAIYSYAKKFVSLSSTEIITTNPVDKFPKEITVNNKNEVFKTIEDFIDAREKMIEVSLDKFNEYCQKTSKNKKITDTEFYNYGHILYLEGNRKTSTEYIFDNFRMDNPYGSYIEDNDRLYFERKISIFNEKEKEKYKLISQQYNLNTINEQEIQYKLLKDMFMNTYNVKTFLKNDITQNDIDMAIEKFQKRTLYGLGTLFNKKMEAIPELWNSVVKKTEYNEPIINFYLDVFYLSENGKYNKLDNAKKNILHLLLQQSLIHRIGYQKSILENFAINKYIGSNTLDRIDNMIMVSIDKIKNNTTAINENKERRKKNHTTALRAKLSNHANGANEIVRNEFNDEGIIYSLDTFTVSIRSDYGRKYLKVIIDFELRDWDSIDEIDAKKAILKDRIVRLLITKKLENINSNNTKNNLIQDIIKIGNIILRDENIKAARFTEFTIQ